MTTTPTDGKLLQERLNLGDLVGLRLDGHLRVTTVAGARARPRHGRDTRGAQLGRCPLDLLAMGSALGAARCRKADQARFRQPDQ